MGIVIRRKTNGLYARAGVTRRVSLKSALLVRPTFRKQTSLVVFAPFLRHPGRYWPHPTLEADLKWLRRKLVIPGWTEPDRRRARKCLQRYGIGRSGEPMVFKTVRFTTQTTFLF